MRRIIKYPSLLLQQLPSKKTIVFSGLITTAAFFRTVKLGSRNGGFDLDEAYYILLAQGDLSHIVSNLMNGAHPPLYFILLHYWTAMFGVSEAATRMPSVIMGVFLIIAVYFVGKSFFSANVGILSMIIVTFNPLHIFYSREARMYSLLPLVSLAVFYFLCSALTKHRAKYWIGLTLSLVVSLYCHNYAVFLIPACASVLLFPSFRSQLRPLLITLAIATICYLPWLHIIQAQTNSPGLEWVRTFFHDLPPWTAIFRSLEVLGAGGKYPPMNYELSFFHPLRWFAVAIYAFLIVKFAMQGQSVNAGNDTGNWNRHARMLLITFLFTPLLSAWVISFWVRPIYIVGRYDMIVFPFYCFIIAWGIDSCGPFFKRLWTVALVLLSLYSLFPYFARPVSLPDRDRAVYLESHVKGNDSILFCGLSGNPIRVHFLRTGYSPRMTSFPSETDHHPGWLNARPDPGSLDQEAQKIVTKNISQDNKIWVVMPALSNRNLILLKRLLENYKIAEGLSNAKLSIQCFVPKGKRIILAD